MKAPVVFAIDPSSKKLSGCISDPAGHIIKMDTRRLASDENVRLGQAHQWVIDLIESIIVSPEDIWVVVESPIVWGSKQSTLVLGQISGALISAAVLANVSRIQKVNPSTWKKQVVGNGAAKKPEIARFLHQHWPDAWTKAHNDGDLIDAACINRYGAAIVTRTDRIQRKATVPVKTRSIRRIR